MNSVSFKSNAVTQTKQAEKEVVTPEKEEMSPEVDSKKSNAAKLMLGATAVAAVVIGGIFLHKGLAARKAAKQAFQEGFNATEHIHIKETPASRNAQAMIDRVENLKAKENSAIKNNPYESIDWDAKPISRTQAMFEHKFPSTRAREAYINPEFEKEFEALEKQGYKINVKDTESGYKEITYIYPESSTIESKVVRGKVADLDKGYNLAANDSRKIRIKLRNKTSGEDTYALIFNNRPFLSDTRYVFESYGDKSKRICRTYAQNEKDLLEGLMSQTQDGNSDKVTKCLQNEFKDALGIA